MWSKSRLLLVRVRVKKDGRPIRFCTALGIYVLTGFLLSWEPLLAVLPGSFWEKARAAVTAALTLLWAIAGEEPQTYAQIDLKEAEQDVFVEVKTL